MSSSTEGEIKTDPRILLEFHNVIESVYRELNKGVVPPIAAAEPRLNGIMKGEATQKYIEDKEKFRDRREGTKLSLAEGREKLFRS